MKWLRALLDKVTEASAAEPFQCPRGWGQVSFHLSLGGWPPWFLDITRTCPIGGVSECGSCKYPFKPEDAQQLRQQLQEVDTLRDEKVLSESEHAARRRMIVGLMEENADRPGEWARIVAWILGPLGVLLTAMGSWLAMDFDPEFWVMAIGGTVILAVCVSFAVIAWTSGQPRSDKPPSRDLSPKR